MKKQGLVTAIFHSKDAASKAFEDLIHKGYDPSEIVVVMSQETYRGRYLGKTDSPNNKNGTTVRQFEQYLARNGTSHELTSTSLVVAGPFATSPALSDRQDNARRLLAAAGIEGDRALIYEPEIHAGGVLIGLLPNGPTDRYTIGHKWRKSEGELILGDDEDF